MIIERIKEYQDIIKNNSDMDFRILKLADLVAQVIVDSNLPVNKKNLKSLESRYIEWDTDQESIA